MQKFSTRYENDYDLTSDERYNAWLKEYHPDDYIKTSRKSSKNIYNCCLIVVAII